MITRRLFRFIVLLLLISLSAAAAVPTAPQAEGPRPRKLASLDGRVASSVAIEGVRDGELAVKALETIRSNDRKLLSTRPTIDGRRDGRVNRRPSLPELAVRDADLLPREPEAYLPLQPSEGDRRLLVSWNSGRVGKKAAVVPLQKNTVYGRKLLVHWNSERAGPAKDD